MWAKPRLYQLIYEEKCSRCLGRMSFFMKMPKSFLMAIIVWLCFTDVHGTCMDIDTVACQLMHAKRPDMCNDTRIADAVCPGFCRKCPIKCYHCDIPLMDYHDCYKIKTCAKGEGCMLKELKSSADGHDEYFMKCATQQECDGAGLTFFFGKRNIIQRDVHARCCYNNLCNVPSGFSTSPSSSRKPAIRTTTTTVRPTTTRYTSHPGCRRDIVFIIDTSMRYYGSGTGIRPFLASSFRISISHSISLIYGVVSNLIIGPHDNRVAVASFDDSVHGHWDLATYNDKAHLLQAISYLRHNITFRTHGDVAKAIDVVVHNALSIQHGDRPNYANDVVIITDVHSAFHNNTLKHSLHHKSRDVIVVYLGTDTTQNTDVDDLATRPDHVIHVPSYSTMSSAKAKLLNLLCY